MLKIEIKWTQNNLTEEILLKSTVGILPAYDFYILYKKVYKDSLLIKYQERTDYHLYISFDKALLTSYKELLDKNLKALETTIQNTTSYYPWVCYSIDLKNTPRVFRLTFYLFTIYKETLSKNIISFKIIYKNKK